ncbi:MAG: putative signal peptide peptidase SppA [Chromatiales bacterium USCg_Taylor]|nr:MAG: putative signal peptide peptidase SppA [Chromatiales bacterium USCg_Taylor]
MDQTEVKGQTGNWEHALIRELALGAITEQRRARRWSILFRSVAVIYVLVLSAFYLSSQWEEGSLSSETHTALVDVDGVIGSDPQASADSVITGLRAAFKNDKTKAVIMRINSPGGSAVHAGYINDEMFRLRALHPNIPVYAVITDICASGGYYIAVAANKIYADKASLIGSIGVAMDGFGFVGTLERLGIERRLHTAGTHKGFLDPFSPANPEDAKHLQVVLDRVHQQFIDSVIKGRGDRLKSDPALFTGLVWSGEQSLNLGLIDAMGSSGFVAREVIGVENIVDFTHREHYFDRWAKQLGAAAAKVFMNPIPALR